MSDTNTPTKPDTKQMLRARLRSLREFLSDLFNDLHRFLATITVRDLKILIEIERILAENEPRHITATWVDPQWLKDKRRERYGEEA